MVPQPEEMGTLIFFARRMADAEKCNNLSRLGVGQPSREKGECPHFLAYASAVRSRCHILLLTLGALAAAGCAGRAPQPATPAAVPAPSPSAIAATVHLEFVALEVLPTGDGLPGDLGFRVGGLSGCVVDPATGHTLVVSDDRNRPRVFAFDIRVDDEALSVSVANVVTVEDRNMSAAGRQVIDMEGIVAVGPGQWLISSEGDEDGDETMPPAITRHGVDGALTDWLDVPDAFLSAPALDPLRGVHANQGLESLTRTPDGRVFTAAEGPLVQDGELPDVGTSALIRLLEYVPAGDTWRPARQFAYAVSPVVLPDGFGPSALSTGVAELLALGDERLLVLERSYIAERGATRRGLNIIRIYEVSTRDADDVSSLGSLRGRPVRPLEKHLVLDLDALKPRLANELPTLENFEAMCYGPRLADGSGTLLLVSDNNFNRRQKTAFLLFRMKQGRT